MNLNQLGALALVLVIGAVIISVGGEILTQLYEQQCDYTYGAYNGSFNYICCQTANVTNTSLCDLTATDGVAATATSQGIEGVVTFSEWIPLIALVVVASIVIGVIVTYMGKND